MLLLLYFVLFQLFSVSVHCAVATLPLTGRQLGAGGASTAVRTGAKLANLHKLSGELLPRLRQTARYMLGILEAIHFQNPFF